MSDTTIASPPAKVKIKETRLIDGGFQGQRTEFRVRELADGEAVPANAKKVTDTTPVSDWQTAPPADTSRAEDTGGFKR